MYNTTATRCFLVVTTTKINSTQRSRRVWSRRDKRGVRELYIQMRLIIFICKSGNRGIRCYKPANVNTSELGMHLSAWSRLSKTLQDWAFFGGTVEKLFAFFVCVCKRRTLTIRPGVRACPKSKHPRTITALPPFPYISGQRAVQNHG